MDATENLHGDGGGLTVDVEVAEDDPATRGGVRGTEGVVREDVQRRLRGRCGARPRTSARGRCCFRAAALGRGVRGRVGDGDGADDRGAAAVGARARGGFEPGDDGVGPRARTRTAPASETRRSRERRRRGTRPRSSPTTPSHVSLEPLASRPGACAVEPPRDSPSAPEGGMIRRGAARSDDGGHPAHEVIEREVTEISIIILRS